MGYCVVSPNTIKSNKGAITVKTVFATLAEAEEHKAQCDKFDEVVKRPKLSYIEKVEENEPSKTIIIQKYIKGLFRSNENKGRQPQENPLRLFCFFAASSLMGAAQKQKKLCAFLTR